MKARTLSWALLMTPVLLSVPLLLVSADSKTDDAQHLFKTSNIQYDDNKSIRKEISSAPSFQCITCPDSEDSLTPSPLLQDVEDFTERIQSNDDSIKTAASEGRPKKFSLDNAEMKRSFDFPLMAVNVETPAPLTSTDNTQFTETSTSTLYSDCPSGQYLIDCGCSDQGIVLSRRTSVNLIGCMTYLGDNNYTRYPSLTVTDPQNMNLSENVLGNVQFDKITFENGAIWHIHKNFLGASSETVTSIRFEKTDLNNTFPKIVSSGLTDFYIGMPNYDDINFLRRGVFDFTPELKTINIETHAIRVARGVFAPLKKLEWLSFMEYTDVYLTFGSFHFTSLHLTNVIIGRYFYPVPGSIEGFPRGSELTVYNLPDGVHPSVFYNHFSYGAKLYKREWNGPLCTCDLAWIRYSSLVDLASIYCIDNGPTAHLSEANLEHCPFYQRLNNRTEL